MNEKEDGFNLPHAVKRKRRGNGFLWEFNALFQSIY